MPKKAAPLRGGDSAPDFLLSDPDGNKISLKDFKGKKSVVLYFYPKDMTPGCTQEACDFRDSFARLKKLGVTVLGVSKDSAESHRKFKGKHDLPFTLLVDTDGELCKSYGVW